jgi:hypothetical protein
MFLDKVDGVLPAQFVRVKYECDGGFERCGKEWKLKLKDAQKNHQKNEGKLICHKCQLKTKNPMLRKEVVEKLKKTNLERYGTECSMNTQELIDKRNEKYEDTEYVAKITSKRRKTCKEKYGVDHPMKTEEVQEKQKAVIREKYGVDHPLQNSEILEKAKQTNLERYGVEWGLACGEVRLKGIKTMLEKYGVTHYNQLPEMKEYLRQNCTEWLAESYDNPWSKGTVRPEAWNEKQRETIDKLINDGLWKAGPKTSLKGNFQSENCKRKNPIFRSSYELKVHWYLDNDSRVEWYDYEPFQVEYHDEIGHLRHFTIDFIVKYKGVKKLLAIEVKNNYTKDQALNHLKYKAFNACCQNLVELKVWANEEIAQLNIDLKDIPNNKIIEWEIEDKS